MEDFTEIFLLVAIIAVVVAAVMQYVESNKLRHCQQFEKVIYNYKGKTQKQIFEILKLEVDHEVEGVQIEAFSEPLFRTDGSAVYIVYYKIKRS